MNLLKDFFGAIATTKIGGIIPLDIVLHFFLGALIYWFLTKFLKQSVFFSLVILLLIALSKEAFDLGVVMRNQFYLEPFKDIIVTMAGALLLIRLSKNQKRFS